MELSNKPLSVVWSSDDLLVTLSSKILVRLFGVTAAIQRRACRHDSGAGSSADDGSTAHRLVACGSQWKPAAPNAANIDEAKANPFPNLPDPLVLNDGQKVTTPQQWWTRRRPELVEMFDREMYGRVPAVTPAVHWEVTKTTPAKDGSISTLTKTLVGHVDNSGDPAIVVDIALTLTTPAQATGPVPVIMEFGFTGFAGMRRRPATAGTTPAGPTWQHQVLEKGVRIRHYQPNQFSG